MSAFGDTISRGPAQHKAIGIELNRRAEPKRDTNATRSVERAHDFVRLLVICAGAWAWGYVAFRWFFG